MNWYKNIKADTKIQDHYDIINSITVSIINAVKKAILWADQNQKDLSQMHLSYQKEPIMEGGRNIQGTNNFEYFGNIIISDVFKEYTTKDGLVTFDIDIDIDIGDYGKGRQDYLTEGGYNEINGPQRKIIKININAYVPKNFSLTVLSSSLVGALSHEWSHHEDPRTPTQKYIDPYKARLLERIKYYLQDKEVKAFVTETAAISRHENRPFLDVFDNIMFPHFTYRLLEDTPKRNFLRDWIARKDLQKIKVKYLDYAKNQNYI